MTVVWVRIVAVVIEHRHLALGIDRDEPGLVLLELVQVDVHALELEALLLEGEQRLEGIGRGFGVVELHHGRACSIATSAGSSFVGIAPRIAAWRASAPGRHSPWVMT